MPDPNENPVPGPSEREPAPPPSSSPLARVVWTLVRSSEQVQVLALSLSGAIAKVGRKVDLVLLNWEALGADETGRRLRQVIQQARRPLVAGIVGGGDGAREVLKGAKPRFTHSRVGLVHVDQTGRLWSLDARSVRKALEDLERTPYPAQREWADFLARTAADRATFEDEQREATEFVSVFSGRPVVATPVLAVVLVAVFGLEFLFGGTESVPVLLRMGALSRERVLDGEVWRLFSCTFLHSGWSHLFFNTYVLWILGNSLERVLGLWRLLVLYGSACLGSSLLSLVFLDGFSVGASGGLWGLLVAEAVLAWRSQGLLPRSGIRAARRAATINLVINVLNSFRPHVDMWGHFGGGAVAAVLMLTGVLTRDLPRIGEMEESGKRLDGTGAIGIPSGAVLKTAGSALTAALVLGLALGLWTGKAWTLKGPIESVRTPLPSLGISLSLPEGLELTAGPPEEPASVAVGDLLTDVGALVVTRYPMDVSEEAGVETAAGLAAALKKAPRGALLIHGPDDVSVAGRRGLAVRYKYDSGLEENLAFAFLADALLKVDSACWPEFCKAVPSDYSVRVLDTLQPLIPGTGE